MPAHNTAQADRQKLEIGGLEQIQIVAFDQSQSLDDFLQPPETNNMSTADVNEGVAFPGNITPKV